MDTPLRVFPKGDLRRMLAVLDALGDEPATIVHLAGRTGLSRKTVGDLLDQARDQAGAEIVKHGPVFQLIDWGPALKKTGVRKLLRSALNAHIVDSSK